MFDPLVDPDAGVTGSTGISSHRAFGKPAGIGSVGIAFVFDDF